MTMKTKKTLQHIAAVAVVLLALCLVFAAPVSAEGTECSGCGTNTGHTHVASATEDGTTKYYTDIQEAIKAAAPAGTVEILGDITVDTWYMFAEELTHAEIITLNINGLTIDGNGHTLTVKSIKSGGNGGYLFYYAEKLNINGLTIKYADGIGGGFGLQSGTIYGVTIDGGNVGILPGTGDITIEDCTFKTGGSAIYYKTPSDNLVITGNTFDGTGDYAVIIRGATTFTDNTVTSGKVNLADSASGTISGNNFGDNRFKVYNDATATISGNTINNLVFENANAEVKSTFTDNTLSDAAKTALESAGPVAKVGNTFYESLQNAINATNTDTQTTIYLLKDVNDADGIMIGKGEQASETSYWKNGGSVTISNNQNIILDLGGHTYTVTNPIGSKGTESLALQLQAGSTVTIMNGAIVAGSQNVKMIIQNYANLTLENVNIDATKGENAVQYVLSNNNGNTHIKSGTKLIAPEGNVSFDVYNYHTGTAYAFGPSVTVYDGAVINGKVELDKHDTAADVTQHKLIINGGDFVGELIIGSSLDASYAKEHITISGGTFSFNPSAYIAQGMEVVQPGDKYLVQKYVDRSSSSSSSSTTEPEEPEQPEEPVVEPETPAAPGEVASSTEVTDGGEVTFDTPAEPENPDAGEPGDAPADAPAEPAVTGVVLPEGTDSEVAFIPVSEKPAPAGKEENTKKVFEINVPKYEKGKPATVKFTMTVAELEKDGKTAADVALWHHDEETGEWTKLVTTFVIKDGIVYFEAITFDFSPFAIVYEDTELPTDEPETPEQPTESPAPILAVLAGLGAAVVLRRK